MIEDSIKRLRAFNKWRTGEDDRTMEEAGIVPSLVTKDIEDVCYELEKLICMFGKN